MFHMLHRSTVSIGNKVGNLVSASSFVEFVEHTRNILVGNCDWPFLVEVLDQAILLATSVPCQPPSCQVLFPFLSPKGHRHFCRTVSSGKAFQDDLVADLHNTNNVDSVDPIFVFDSRF